MDGSLTQTVPVVCPKCQRNFEAEAWVIIDAVFQKGPLEELAAGTLNVVSCAYCQNSGIVLRGPLVLFCRNWPHPLLCARVAHLPPKENDQYLLSLIHRLRAKLSSEWQDRWLKSVRFVDYEALPQLLPLVEVDPVSQPFREEPPLPSDLSTTAEPRTLVISLLMAKGYKDLKSQVESTPTLLSDETDEVLGRLYEDAKWKGLDDVTAAFGYIRNLLRRCRTEGTEKALANLPTSGHSELKDLYLLLPPELQACLSSVVAGKDNAPLAELAADAVRLLSHPSFSTLETSLRLRTIEEISPLLRDGLPTTSTEARFLDEVFDAVDHLIVAAIDEEYKDALFYLLSVVLMRRYQLKGSAGDIHQAIDILKRMSTAKESSDAGVWGNLGVAFRLKYQGSGDSEDLAAAMHYWSRALELESRSSLTYTISLLNLASGLRDTYLRQGDLESLDRAVAHLQEAVEFLPPTTLPTYYAFRNLGEAFLLRFRHTRGRSDLERAIRLFRIVAEGMEEFYPTEVASSISALGTALLARREGSDLEDAAALFERALLLTEQMPPDYARIASNLAGAILEQDRHHHEQARLLRAIDLMTTSVRMTPASSPLRAKRLFGLAEVLLRRHTHSPSPGDWEVLTHAFQEAAGAGLDCSLETALRGAKLWMLSAIYDERWEGAIEASAIARTAVAQLVRQQLVRVGKELWLQDFQGVSSMAAYALARVGRLREAVVWLESGCSQLLAATLEIHHDVFTALRTKRPDLASRLEDAARRLRATQTHDTFSTSLLPAGDHLARARAARDDLQSLIEAARREEGFETFLDAPSFDTVKGAYFSGDEPEAVVYLTATLKGSLSIVVTPRGEQAVWSGVNQQGLERTLAAGINGGYLGGVLGQPDALEDSLEPLLESLGSILLREVAEALVQNDVKRVTLIPVGILGLLPLHACRYRLGEEKRCLLDDFIVVYQPHAVRRSASEGASDTQAPHFLGVGNPDSARPLTGAEAEVAAIAAMFPATLQTTLYRDEASGSRLEAALARATILHLSCHASFDLANPLLSGLHLSDGHWTLKRLLTGEIDLRSTRLVVLSACQTAVIDFLRLPDEAVGLPAALFGAGASCVVGTLWPVDDVASAMVMIRFYQVLLGLSGRTPGPSSPAQALRLAQLWVRDSTCAELIELIRQVRESFPLSSQAAMQWLGALASYFATLPETDRPFAQASAWAGFVVYGEGLPRASASIESGGSA